MQKQQHGYYGKNENRIAAHADQIRSKGDYKEENEEELSIGIASYDLMV